MNLKYLLVFTLSTLIGCLAQSEDARTESFNDQNVCTAEACNSAASFLLNNIDKSVDPCNDFYQFACGNFIKTSEPEYTRRSYNLENIWKFLKTSLLEEPKDGEPETFKKLKYYYKTCQNDEEKQNENKFINLLKKLGGWPLIDENSWNPSIFNRMRLINLFPEKVSQESGTDKYYSVAMKFNIQLNQYLSKILSSNKTEAYLKFMTSVTESFKTNSANVTQEIVQVLDLEVKLNKIKLADTSDSKIVTLGQLKIDFPAVRWSQILLKFSGQDSDEILFYNHSGFEKLYRLITNTPDRVLANYFGWILFFNSHDIYSKRFGDEIEKLREDFVYEVTGERFNYVSPSQHCLVYLSFEMNLAFNVFLLRKHFDTRGKGYLKNLVDDVRASFRQVLNNSDWLDQNVKQQLIQRLDKLKVIDAYSDEFLINDTLIDSYYKNLTIGSEDFSSKSQSVNEIIESYGEEDISYPLNKYNFLLTTAFFETNVNRTKEHIVVPLWMIAGSNLNVDVPNYLNYGMLGFLVAHEFGHGFDYHYHRGLSSENEVLKRTRCIQDQYSNFSIEGSEAKFDGRRTSDEDVADNIGTKVAHSAYQSWQIKNGIEAGLPGFGGFSPNQLFWISYASFFCEKIPEHKYIEEVEDSSYTTSEFRVKGPLVNSPEFARDFNCPIGSGMNPAEKCYLY